MKTYTKQALNKFKKRIRNYSKEELQDLSDRAKQRNLFGNTNFTIAKSDRKKEIKKKREDLEQKSWIKRMLIIYHDLWKKLS